MEYGKIILGKWSALLEFWSMELDVVLEFKEDGEYIMSCRDKDGNPDSEKSRYQIQGETITFYTFSGVEEDTAKIISFENDTITIQESKNEKTLVMKRVKD
jgi:hypothetical protein